MKVYSYCSYEGSPCGFILGSFTFNTDAEFKQSDTISLNNDETNPFIQTIFEYGSIDFVFGKLHNNEPYKIIIKNIDQKNSKPYLYMNFAFETDNKEEYLTLLSSILHKYENIKAFTNALSEFVILQTENHDYGLVINLYAVSKFWKSCQADKKSLDEYYKTDEQIYLFRKILSDTANKDRSKELTQAFDIEKGYSIIHNEEYHCHIILRGSKISHILKSKVNVGKIKNTYDEIKKKGI